MGRVAVIGQRLGLSSTENVRGVIAQHGQATALSQILPPRPRIYPCGSNVRTSRILASEFLRLNTPI